MHYTGRVWEVRFSHEAEAWIDTLTDGEYRSFFGAVDALELVGPSLGRPIVDTIRGSRHTNMKELRSVGGNLRALFAFDPKRQAIILLGGDKTGNWRGWYEQNIPKADDLYDDYLDYLKEHQP